MTWHPRGTPTWADWQQAAPGTRVRHVRTGRTGTYVGIGNLRGRNRHALVDWDYAWHGRYGGVRGTVVAPAFDLAPIDEPDE